MNNFAITVKPEMTLSKSQQSHEVVFTRELNAKEKLEVQSIFQRIYNHYGGPGYLEYLINSVSEKTLFILIKKQGVVVATGAIYNVNDHAGEVFFVAVHPQHRRQGLGMAVNQAAETYARNNLGLKVLYTGPLINFYELHSKQLHLNLGNLVATKKQGYILTGFTPGQYIDFMYKPSELPDSWIQNLSGCLMAKAVDESEGFQEEFQHECVAARAKLVSALTREACSQQREMKEADFEQIVEIDGGLDAEGKPLIIISKLAYSREVEALLAALGSEEPFVPCGYYPSYRRLGETYYVGINIQKLVSLSSEKIWRIDRQALGEVLPEPDMTLLDLIITKMTLVFEKKARSAVELCGFSLTTDVWY